MDALKCGRVLVPLRDVLEAALPPLNHELIPYEVYKRLNISIIVVSKYRNKL